MSETQIEPTLKKHKLSEKKREYFKLDQRKRRGWKCADCGALNPTVKTLEGKKKLCDACDKKRLIQKYSRKEPAT
jgi:hypothetical protein